MATEINFLVGGEAGQGVQSVGFVLAKTMARGGLHVFADQDYESRVRGGHNFFRIRASDTEIHAHTEAVDVLIALNRETVDRHRKSVRAGGVIIFDREQTGLQGRGKAFLDVPIARLAEETTGNKLMTNTVATGAAVGLVDYDFDRLATVLVAEFHKAGDDVAADNVKAARAGYDYARQQAGKFARSLKPVKAEPRMLLNGNEAIALGAMVAGCKFVAAYPMTPASSIMEYISDKGRDYNVVVVQPEDEISAINMAIGAGYAGARAMTATSGGGFALMAEGLGLAGITETPVVIVLAQRPGPAIGLPTRTEQGELGFALSAGNGEFPRAVLAPTSVEDAFRLTVKAFNLAEQYQLPVIIITDQYLASSYQTAAKFDLKAVRIDRGQLLSEAQANRLTNYKRHRYTESGVSPRALPMIGRALVVTDSDEHDEAGHMIEDAGIRTRMVQKRQAKLGGLKAEISPPYHHRARGAKLTLVGWGSTGGAIQEAAARLKREGVPTSVLHLTELWPFPAEAVTAALKNTRSVVIENNATGQLARLIRAETGIKAESLLKYDGRPFSPEYIVREMRKEVA